MCLHLHLPLALHCFSRLPYWIQSFLPKIFYVTEKAWNYYPFTITGLYAWLSTFKVSLYNTQPFSYYCRNLKWTLTSIVVIVVGELNSSWANIYIVAIHSVCKNMLWVWCCKTALRCGLVVCDIVWLKRLVLLIHKRFLKMGTYFSLRLWYLLMLRWPCITIESYDKTN